ncbi:DGQHR domain-containing protein [Bacillus pinisoli]|uniref:DGQHR domain-containing protein n=1 Tax=Bacillus pinisoli TaxID=2901866 RepID=UPI001FF6F984|nr:DGQHR domain-containing protein [Bacillus pinisoli]
MSAESLSYKYIEIEQPIGTIYIGKLNAEDIYSISYSRIRTEYEDGIQRVRNEDRVKAIANYCKDPDAIFPTPIILSGDSKYVEFDLINQTINLNLHLLSKDNYRFSIVDGQHRIEGIHRSGFENRFILPIMLILDTTPEQDAYLFSVINGNQKPVSKSQVLDLFSLSSERTVQKVCNYLVKQLNSDSDSALYRKIKMLGIKDEVSPKATVSQATIIKNLIKYISRNVEKDNLDIKLKQKLEILDPNTFIFRDYFIREEDDVIYRVLLNYFNAIYIVENNLFNNKLIDEKTINFLNKTVGYTTKIQLLRPLYLKGLGNKSLKVEYFESELDMVFEKYNELYPNLKISDNYGSSESGAKELYLDLINCWVLSNEENKRYLSKTEIEKIDPKKNM